MKKLLLISLCLGLFLQTALAQKTYRDSIDRAFDNCVYEYDSVVHELNFAKEIIQMDSAVNAESNEEIELLHQQVDELKIQNTNYESAGKKDSLNLIECQIAADESLTKEKKKAKGTNWIAGTISFFGGAGIGGAIVGLYLLLKP